MKKYISNPIKSLTIAGLLIICLNSYGQDKKQEISISVGGPFSFMKYNSIGEVESGNGINAGIRYSYYLNEGLSIGIGAEYQTYNSDGKFGFLTGAYTTTDAEDESFQFRYRATNLREEQKLGYVNIPVNIQFETPGTSKLYVSAGFKVGFAVSGTYETKMQNLTTSGYYPQYNVELFSPAFAGFASTDNLAAGKQDIDTEVSYSTTFETGLKQKIGDRSWIYVGVYLDYGLNNIYDKGNNKALVEYHPELPVQLQYNSVLETSYTNDVRLVSYGLKLRFALH
ncbi:outer membrane beta-barrel protein [Flavobacterium sp. MMLR14_040]|uniref:outer membrane beta-barrel protein n=1 Tax=Flavobacterium sp. MMLR14_040 TaxID=3093843 RepID=UPI00298F61FD|nr:outer membrane beta-barrel protein [Flavobacterium sp. MMLR14_040]MDW8850809.1 outer membrane beta-barrel protein [Flavobacterium sp. MMLR14_040]